MIAVATNRREGTASCLLLGKEREVPKAVLETVRFFDERGLWYALSRNPEARSCRDAARKRMRAGRIGIPLRDEMKSFFGCATFERDGEATSHYAMAHCRGDCRLDLSSVSTALGWPAQAERVGSDELARFGFEYGLVNPFVDHLASDKGGSSEALRHVFDIDLVGRRSTPPRTTMTNAGDLTWAVEFRPDQLFKTLSAVHVSGPNPWLALAARVAIPDMTTSRRPETRPHAMCGSPPGKL